MRKHIKAYLITDPNLYPNSPLKFYDFYKNILDSHAISFACYRDKESPNPKLFEVFLKLNQSYQIPSLLNSYFDVALQYGFDGLHCNGKQMHQISDAIQKLPLVFFSAHNEQEIKEADSYGANGIAISPIFQTPNKGKPLGVDFLKRLDLNCYKAEIFALGGIISQKEILEISQIPFCGFASIRYFLNS